MTLPNHWSRSLCDAHRSHWVSLFFVLLCLVGIGTYGCYSLAAPFLSRWVISRFDSHPIWTLVDVGGRILNSWQSLAFSWTSLRGQFVILMPLLVIGASIFVYLVIRSPGLFQSAARCPHLSSLAVPLGSYHPDGAYQATLSGLSRCRNFTLAGPWGPGHNPGSWRWPPWD